eukprot:m.5007 g.5007  ORF g.5007 m.5007 type:complete len:920 (-) comp3164_c0_seq1:18-2777(-)
MAFTMRLTLLVVHVIAHITASNGSWHSAKQAHKGSQTSRLVFTVNMNVGGHRQGTILYNDTEELDKFFIEVTTNGRITTEKLLLDKQGVKVVFPLRQGINIIQLRVHSTSPSRASSIGDILDTIEGLYVEGSVPAPVGGIQPFVTLEAEDAICTGKVIGPTYLSYTDTIYLPTEASNRMACQLNTSTTEKEYVQFTTSTSFNALSLRYSIPDSPTGGGLTMQVDVVINNNITENLTLTSAYSWFYGKYPFTNDPKQGNPHHFYNEGRLKLSNTYPAGTTVKIMATNSNMQLLTPGRIHQKELFKSGESCSTNKLQYEKTEAGDSQPPPPDLCQTNDTERVGCGFDGITAAQCHSLKCCFKELPNPNPHGYPYCFHTSQPPSPSPSPPTPPSPPSPSPSMNCSQPLPSRKDCGFFNITPAQCIAKGCCYKEDPPAPNPKHIPWCFFNHEPGPNPPHPSPPHPPPPPPPSPTPLPPAPPHTGITIDLIDLYNVPLPLSPPANALNVVSFGADPEGKMNSLKAFQDAVNAASKNGGGAVWIPPGSYLVQGHVLMMDNVSLHGAGPWYSLLHGTGNTVSEGAIGIFAQTKGTKNLGLFDFAIIGDIRERNDGQPVQGVGGAPVDGSTIQNIYIQHTKCGFWLDGPGADLVVAGNIVRDTMADGINLHTGWDSVTITHNSFRNTGDDGIALWSQNTADTNISITFNLVQVPVLANCIAIYGGNNNKATDNVLADSIQGGGGVHVGNRFTSVPLAGTTLLARNSIYRGGCLDMNWKFGVGSLWFYALDGAGIMDGEINIVDTIIADSPYNAIFLIGNTIKNINFHNVSVNNAQQFVLELRGTKAPYATILGSASFSSVKADKLNYTAIYNCENQEPNQFDIIDMGGNIGWLQQCHSNNDCGNTTVTTTCQGASQSTSYCAHCGFP